MVLLCLSGIVKVASLIFVEHIWISWQKNIETVGTVFSQFFAIEHDQEIKIPFTISSLFESGNNTIIYF